MFCDQLSRLPKWLARYLRTPSAPAINRSTKLSTTIVTSARSTGSSPIGRLGSTVTTRSRYSVRAASAVGAGSPDGFRAQCPASAATTGASVSAEPAPKTK
jgi:hypothetical protein